MVSYLKLILQSRYVRQAHFNVKVFFTQHALRRFRSRPEKVTTVSKIIRSQGPTACLRSSYITPTAACIVLCRPSSPCRCSYLGYMVGMPSQALSEIFWQAIAMFNSKFVSLNFNIGYELLQNTSRLDSDCIAPHEATLPNFVGFLAGTNIFLVPTRWFLIELESVLQWV